MTDAHAGHLTRDTLVVLLAAAGVPADDVRAVHPLAGGTFNTVYRVRRAAGTDLVVKVAPDPSEPLMRYEQRILRTEARYYELAAGLDVPLPTLRYAGFDHRVIDRDYVVLSACPGTPWNVAGAGLRDGHAARLRRDLGGFVADLHRLTGTGFGYPTEVLGPLSPTWRAAFQAMTAAVLADAERFAVRLPRPVGQLRDLVAAHAPVLDEVTVPVLVHFDLWDGNILLDTRDGTPRIGGIIDAERAFWGDPLAELVSLALFGSIEANRASDTAFLDGYRANGGQVRFGPSERTRLSLFRSYLYLIMLVEAAPRGYDEQHLRWLDRQVTPALVADLDALSAAAG